MPAGYAWPSSRAAKRETRPAERLAKLTPTRGPRMNGRAPSASARTLVARSRSPARSTAPRLAGGTILAPSRGGPAPAARPGPVPAAPPPPAAQAPATKAPAPLAAPQVLITRAQPPPLAAQAPTTAAPAPPTALTPAGQPLRYPEAAAQAATGSPGPASSAGPTVPAAPLAPAQATAPAPPGSPPAPVSPAGRPAATREPPSRYHAPRTPARPAPAAGPQAQGQVGQAGPEVLTSTTGVNPLVERAYRPARSVKRSDTGPVRPAAALPPEPATAKPPAPEHSAAVPGPRTDPRAAPAHPPVTIGEIHVHVAEPPAAAADPLALLAPYARGLTARRDGAW